MKFICAPDSFKGSIDAVRAARAIARGIRSVRPDAEIDCCPVGDGGEGTLSALLETVDGTSVPIGIHDIFGGLTKGSIGHFDGRGFAFVETAMATGARVLPDGQTDVMRASSFGAGELLLAACDHASSRVLVGLGGSATNDGGCGLAQALGVRFLDANDNVIDTPIGGGMLSDIDAIDVSRRDDRVRRMRVVALCDVTNPLTGPNGAAHVFGPQKGADANDVAVLDAGLEHLARLIERDLGLAVSNLPGAGAAGGLGAGLVAFAGATIARGIDTVLAEVEFDARCRGATLCVTGEGRLDAQSLEGKACIGVARSACRQNVPVVALVGSTGTGAERCLDAGISEYRVIGEDLSADRSIRDAEHLLEVAAADIARRYEG
jgi:glycerate kinase